MHITALKNAMNSLKDETELIGGWEERLKDIVSEPDDQFFLKGIELTKQPANKR